MVPVVLLTFFWGICAMWSYLSWGYSRGVVRRAQWRHQVTSLAKNFVVRFELTDCGDQSVGEEHRGCQVPVWRGGGVSEDGDAVLVGRQDFDQKAFEGRGADAALVQKLLLQGFHVMSELVLHRPLDAGENQRSEQQVDDIEENEAGEQQPRPAYRMHVWVQSGTSISGAADRASLSARRTAFFPFPLCVRTFFGGCPNWTWTPPCQRILLPRWKREGVFSSESRKCIPDPGLVSKYTCSVITWEHVGSYSCGWALSFISASVFSLAWIKSFDKTHKCFMVHSSCPKWWAFCFLTWLKLTRKWQISMLYLILLSKKRTEILHLQVRLWLVRICVGSFHKVCMCLSGFHF